LVQIASEAGNFLIDPIKIKDLTPLFALLSDPSILKITHAGENDYRLLYNNFGVVPQNVFDTQVAAGFLGYGYPVSFQRLVDGELGIQLDKTYVVADWEARPMKNQQIDYALNDVAPLRRLYDKLNHKLKRKNRAYWVKSELEKWEQPDFYARDPHGEALSSTLMNNLRPQKQVFLLRLYEWRREEAKRLNWGKEMVLAAKHISPILRGVDMGKHALLDNRTIPNHVVEQHWASFDRLYRKEISAEELDVLKRLPPPSMSETPRQQVSMEILHALVRYRCVEAGVASSLVMNKSDLTYAQPGEDIFEDKENDWRRDFLGEALLLLLNRRGEIDVEMGDGKVILSMSP
jgi:ribonuclease D